MSTGLSPGCSSSDVFPAKAARQAAADGSSAGPLPSTWELGCSSRLPASAWPSPGLCSYLGSEPKDGRSLSLSLCNSAFQINQSFGEKMKLNVSITKEEDRGVLGTPL